MKVAPAASLESESSTFSVPMLQPLRSAYILSVMAVQAPRLASSRLKGAGPAFCPPAPFGSSDCKVKPPVSIDCE